MDQGRIDELIGVYRDGLLDDTLPFWTRNSVDREHGGFMFCLDRDGTVVDTDKGVWTQARFTWLLATLCDQVEPRAEWMELAEHGVEFLRRHCFDADGRMFFQVTRDGRPLRKRRYVFTETFGALAFAAWSKVSGDQAAAQQAADLFDLVQRHATTPGLIPPKTDPTTRPGKSIGFPMIMMGTAQILRDAIGFGPANDCIDDCIREIREDFMNDDLEAVLESVGPSGEVLDHFDGRTLNPGHAIEAAWFILLEAQFRKGDKELLEMGVTMLDWMWKRGWDREYGGLLYFCDLKGHPVQEYWHDMKFWWPHNEAINATLLAHALTGEDRFARLHETVHDWAYAHFPDPEFGEWYGYLHRDGGVSVPLKGNLWKGPFHLPRMQLFCWKLLESMKQENA